jgi:Selenocysteine lyase
MGFLGKKTARLTNSGDDFGYLDESAIYFDSACQSLRPIQVIDALEEYYKEFNSCGERVKYEWGRRVDDKVSGTREAVLKFLKLSTKDYFVSFTLNTTYGINLILSQLKLGKIEKVVTSDIEHNSPFLSTMAFAKKHGIKREVLTREDDGSIDLEKFDLGKALVVVNAVSNIDGRKLKNIREVITKVHEQGGLIVIDAAQAMAHHHEMLEGCEADAICFSGHKLYSSSLGGMIVKKSLLDHIDTSFIGGGMVDDVTLDEYKMSFESSEHVHTIFEAGLQAWGEIIALNEAIKWLRKTEKNSNLEDLSRQIFDFLKSNSKIHVINDEASSTISFYHEEIDSHLLAAGMSGQGIMARSGYFCCHYYLDHVKKYPPLVRFSLGHHNKQSDVDRAIKALERVL